MKLRIVYLLAFQFIGIASHADDLDNLVQGIGKCKEVRIVRDVRKDQQNVFGAGFNYKTSDGQTIEKILLFLRSIPTKDFGQRLAAGEGLYPDAPDSLEISLIDAGNSKCDIVIFGGMEIVFNRKQVLEHEAILDIRPLYKVIGRANDIKLNEKYYDKNYFKAQ